MPLPSTLMHDAEIPHSGPTFSILTVCTGNICRSPQLEQLLREGLADELGSELVADLRYGSAGTRARDGLPMEPTAAELARSYGVPESAVSAHRSRRLTPSHLDGVDLVLALAQDHRSDAVGLAPHVMRRSFTLLEFGRIVHHLVDPVPGVRHVELSRHDGQSLPDFLRTLVRQAASLRGVLPPTQHSLDVEDPMGRSRETFERSANLIAGVTRRLIDDVRLLAADR